MLQTLKNAWKEPDIRKKIFFTFFILLLYRIGTVIPVPFVNAQAFASSFLGGTVLDYMNTLSGGSLQMATLFALGISPYITASIVIQLLTVAIPALEKWAKEGEEGKKKINNLTRYTTVILAVVTAVGYYFLLKPSLTQTTSVWLEVLQAFVIIVSYCAGAAMVMWLAEKINEKGLGNGISIILFANIISALPSKIIRLVKLSILGCSADVAPGKWGTLAILFALFYVGLLVAMVIFCVFVTGSERRLNVQYAKRVVGRKMYGGQSQSLPLKLNMSGVMPVIFASSLISLPATFMAFFGLGTVDKQAFLPLTGEGVSFWKNLGLNLLNVLGGGKDYAALMVNESFSWKNLFININSFLSSDGWFYPLALFILIIAFSYFYIQISFNPIEVANNLKQNGGSILGIRPGRPTAQYIQKSLSKITLIGAFFLSIVAIVPILLVPLVMEPLVEGIAGSFALTGTLSPAATKFANEFGTGAEAIKAAVGYYTGSFAFGGTSLLIVVGVALETVRDLEAQLSMRNYKGFLN